MLTRTSFEESLRAFATAPVGVAANDESALEALRDAIARLDATPSLFYGDSDGVFTYDDPILAVAVAWMRAGLDAPFDTAAAGEELQNRAIWRWVFTGIRAWLSRGNIAFATLGGRTPIGPISIDGEVVRFAVVGDAGYACDAQANVLRSIRKRHREQPFDLIIHLGDTYFAGSEREMLRHFLAPFSMIDEEARVVTLCGNHDLYYGPEGYSAALTILHQPGRYFTVVTPYWKVACLDTALGSERTLRNDGKLDDGQFQWLDRLLDSNDGKRLVVMSHHFIVSDWEEPAPSLFRQLNQCVRDRVFAWYWGHEHCCATYERNLHGFYGACVGNGAFLERWRPPTRNSGSVSWYAKGRCSCYRRDGPHFWPHGYLEIELTSKGLVETYHLENSELYTRVLSI